MNPSHQDSGTQWAERALMALREAVAGVIAEHKRLGLPLAVWRDEQVVWISADEALEECARQAKDQNASVS